MKTLTSVNTILYLIVTMIVITSVGCRPDFGEKYVVKGTEIYYKDGVTLADAERLGKQLEKMEFVDGNTKSVQLLKRDSVWEFKMATSNMATDEAAKSQLKLYCLELSSAFDGDEVELHICDQKLETKSVVKGLRGLLYENGKNRYFYKDVELEQVKCFAAIAFGTQLDNGFGFNYHLSQPEAIVEIRLAYPGGANDEKRLAALATATASVTSKNCFDGKQVDVLICDLGFATQNTYSSKQKVATATAAP